MSLLTCAPACPVYSLPRFPHLFSTCEETRGGNHRIYVPVPVIFPIALLYKHGMLKMLFSGSVEVDSGHSAEPKARSGAILANAGYPLF